MKKNVIIGTFTGKCCDAEIYNNNDMLLNRELFEKLIASEEYKRAMKNRYYIGFLGHPEDPNCMDYQNGAIVMTSMTMHDDGEIWGTFDLIDTPVGQVVKTFIDAGVTFGISIRGAGDIDSQGKVDPDTFVFRGFDLVTFPAYDDAVPEFKEIAASSDATKQSKYKKICAVLKDNLSKIQSCEALEIIQSQFADSSREYSQIEDRIDELSQPASNEVILVLEQKVDALTKLYIQQVQNNQQLFDENTRLQLQLADAISESDRKIHSIDRIMSSQVHSLEKALTAAENKYKTAVNANSKLKAENQQQVSACSDLESRLEDMQSQYRTQKLKTSRLESALGSNKSNLQGLNEKLSQTEAELQEIKESNLIYQRKIESTTEQLADKDEIIASLQSKLSETVTANQKLGKATSNRDGEIERLTQQIMSCQQLVEEYQQAYADMCAGAIGIGVDNIPITSTTSPSELKSYIYGSTSTSGVPAMPQFVEPEQIERVDDDYYSGTEGLISL